MKKIVKDENIIGIWILSGSFIEQGSMPEIKDIRKYRQSYKDWLLSDNYEPLEKMTEASGLELRIEQDGSFTERQKGTPNVAGWFNEEGILDNNVQPFDGRYFISGARAYLKFNLTDEYHWNKRAFTHKYFRFDDGDTKICDSLRVVESQLIRTMMVLTDELWTTRLVFRYRR